MIPGLATSSAVVRPTWLDQLDAAAFLGLVMLGIVSSLLASGPWLAGMIFLVVLALLWTGLNVAMQWRAIKPWLPVAVFVLIIHTLTTTAVAPLGHPSWGGFRAGLLALSRIALALSWVALFARLNSLDDLVKAVCWWLRPFEKAGLPTGQLALVLAVALGTIPGVMSEGRRVESVLRMRRASPHGASVSLWRNFLDRVLVVVPLMEGLARRAEVLSLSLRTRQPSSGLDMKRPPVGQLLILVLWLVLLLRIFLSGEIA